MNWRLTIDDANAQGMMTPAQASVVEKVLSRFGPKAATTEREVIAPWLSDWRGRYHGTAPAMLAPASTQEVAAIVGMAAALGVALVPQGGNTSMVGGATPPADGSALLLSLRRMNRIRAVSADDRLAIVDAGVILSDLHAAAETAGCRFPLSLGAQGSATIGGLVSTNAGGVQVLRWGTMRGLVAGLEAVLPDGSVHEGLAPLKKDNRGYDLNQLLIGAEGTLGIVTGATLRLAPAIAGHATAWVGLDSPQAGLALLRRFEAATTMVESFEIVPDTLLQLVLAHVPATRAPLAGSHRWHVLIEAVTGDPAQRQAPAALLEDVLGTALGDDTIVDAAIAASEAQGEAFWRIRHSISEAERAAGPAVHHDISVPVAGMPDYMVNAAAAVERAFPGTVATAFGHLGDGNVHFNVRAPEGVDREAWYANDGAAITRMVNDLVVAAGGSISAEHGIGQMKIGELARLSPPARLAALRAVKRAFDPSGLLNPGKLVPALASPRQAS